MKDADVMLLGACRAKDMAKIKRALAQGGDPLAKGKGGTSAMTMVIDDSQTDILEVLLDKSNWQRIAFNYAMSSHKLAMATFMINRKTSDLLAIGSILFSRRNNSVIIFSSPAPSSCRFFATSAGRDVPTRCSSS